MRKIILANNYMQCMVIAASQGFRNPEWQPVVSWNDLYKIRGMDNFGVYHSSCYKVPDDTRELINSRPGAEWYVLPCSHVSNALINPVY